MKKLGMSSLFVLALSLFAFAQAQAQNVTIEVRNCTDETWCAVANSIYPVPSGCPAFSLGVCTGSNLISANSTTTRTFDPNCQYLVVSQQTGGSALFTNNDPSGSYGDFCVCWDYTGTDPVVTIYEGDCSPPCPAPACP